jgi:hypothetical protein
MPSTLRQFHLPLTEQQHAALEAYAKERGLSKTDAAREIFAEKIADFGSNQVQKRGKYQRKANSRLLAHDEVKRI